jgi:hypothetical protein
MAGKGETCRLIKDLLEISSKPDSRRASKSEFSDNLVFRRIDVTDFYGIETSFAKLIESFFLDDVGIVNHIKPRSRES